MTVTDKHAFRKIFSTLAVTLREANVDVVVIAAYFAALQDLELAFVQQAADHLARTSQWFPKPVEWHTAAQRIEAARLEEQKRMLRRLQEHLCPVCEDTSWRTVDDGAVRPCECREARRLELIGERPWPQFPEARCLPPVSEQGPTDAESAAALAHIERLGLRPRGTAVTAVGGDSPAARSRT